MKGLGYILKDGQVRRSGQTIRQIDAEIQELFTTGKTTVIDHAHKFKDGSDLSIDGAQQDHVHRLFIRLRNEHDMTLTLHYSYNKKTGEVTLNNLK